MRAAAGQGPLKLLARIAIMHALHGKIEPPIGNRTTSRRRQNGETTGSATHGAGGVARWLREAARLSHRPTEISFPCLLASQMGSMSANTVPYCKACTEYESEVEHEHTAFERSPRCPLNNEHLGAP